MIQMIEPARFRRIVTSAGIEWELSAGPPGVANPPRLAKHLITLRIDGEAWIKVVPWPWWEGSGRADDAPFLVRFNSLDEAEPMPPEDT